MMELGIQAIASAVGAKNAWEQWPSVTISGVEIDTRALTSNALFVPLQEGARDGHEFAQQAIEQGASLLFWCESVALKAPDFPHLIVTDTLVAMQQLAAYYLKEVAPKVIGVTGSNGKTTTKDMIGSVLQQKYVTYKTQGNYNNHIGLPYTILHMPVQTEMLVLEMGMDHFGEIAALSHLAKPDVAVITMIGESHIEYLGSRQGIAQAKLEIVTGLDAEGLLLIPSEEPLLASQLAGVSQQVETVGSAGSGDWQAVVTHETKTSTSFTVNRYKHQSFTLPVLGRYNVTNALLALAVGAYFEVPVEQLVEGLATLDLTKSRTEWLKAANGAEILSDVYNANPTAMKLVIDAFSGLDTLGKKIAVLADMGDLGIEAKEMHESIAAHLDPRVVTQVFLYGAEMQALYERLATCYKPEQLAYFPLGTKEQLIAQIKKTLQPADIILLKGSNSMKLIEIVESLTEN